MERLTWRTTIGTPHFNMSQKIRNDNIARSAFYQTVCCRIAEYEDIGTPQEFAELKAENERLKAQKNDWKQRHESSEQRYTNLVTSSAECVRVKMQNYKELCKITAGIPLDRLKEICEAVRLNQKELVYIISENKVIECYIRQITINEYRIAIECWSTSSEDYCGYSMRIKDISNTLFIGKNARERAEARLKELRGE